MAILREALQEQRVTRYTDACVTLLPKDIAPLQTRGLIAPDANLEEIHWTVAQQTINGFSQPLWQSEQSIAMIRIPLETVVFSAKKINHEQK